MKTSYVKPKLISRDYFNQISLNISKDIYRSIGEGSARKVYDLGKGRVLKLAKNKKGLAQNEAEYKIALSDNSDLFAPVLEVSDDFRFLVMSKAARIKDISYVWAYFEVYNNKELLSEIKKECSKYNLVLLDLSRAVNWGQINGKPVIVDYGFTRQVSKKFYGFPLFRAPRRKRRG